VRLLLISDIHSNKEALDAVLAEARRRGFDEVLCIGDIVGYYADPNYALDVVRELNAVTVLGNHDAAAISALDNQSSFNTAVVGIVEWHQQVITAEHKEWLRSLKYEMHHGDLYMMVHGTPRNFLEYLLSIPVAKASLQYLKEKICFVGHTHIPLIIAATTSKDGPEFRAHAMRDDVNMYRLPKDAKLFVNPGSVGQSRDGIPKASFGILDTIRNTIEIIRVGYDWVPTQEKVRQNGLPEALATRLPLGR